MAEKVLHPGQTVSLKSRAGLSPATPDVFQVTMRLGNSGGRPLYRIRNNEHDYERVEPGSNLTSSE